MADLGVRRMFCSKTTRDNQVFNFTQQLYTSVVSSKNITVVRVLLFGGLGNQLFQYAHGCKVAEDTGAELQLDLRGLPSRGQQKGSDIRRLDIPYSNVKSGFTYLNPMWKLFLLKSYRRRPSPVSDYLLGVSTPNRKRGRASSASILADYYHTPDALTHFKGALPLEFAAETPNEVSELENYVSSPNTITVHHRLGDTIGLKQTRGLLGPGYFKDSIRILEANTETSPRVVIFTDDIKNSKSLLGTYLRGIDVSWLPPTLDAAEVLYLMSRASNLVLSNSTLSWWAGAAGTHDAVVAPSAWNRAGDNSLNLDNWLLSNPDWT